jgi:hypothetical protein
MYNTRLIVLWALAVYATFGATVGWQLACCAISCLLLGCATIDFFGCGWAHAAPVAFMAALACDHIRGGSNIEVATVMTCGLGVGFAVALFVNATHGHVQYLSGNNNVQIRGNYNSCY